MGLFWKIAIRHAFKNRMYVFSNITGLLLGFTAFYLIGLYLQDELNYDSFHNDHDKVFRVIQFGNYGGIVERSSSCPFPLGPSMQEHFSDRVAGYTRVFNNQSVTTLIKYKNVSINDSGFFYVDSGFFDVFTVNRVKGIQEQWLTQPFQAVITRSAAKKYFGYENAIGKTLSIENQFEVKIVAVVNDWPKHSHFQFSVLVSMETYKKLNDDKLPSNWIGNPCWTYIKVRQLGDEDFIKTGLPGFVDQWFTPSIKDNNSLFLQPLTDIHLKSNLEYEIQKNGNVNYLYIFGGIAIFLILMAAINYVNLTTATFAQRAKEIAVKKLQGASAATVRKQLFLESLAITFTSSVVAIALTELLMPWFNDLTGKLFDIRDLLSVYNLFIIIALNLLIAFTSGLYPAFFISKLRPVNILRGNFKRGAKSGLSRKILVVVQLFVSALLIHGALTINDQYRHLTTGDNGVDRDNLVVIKARFTDLQKKYLDFKTTMERDRSVVGVTGSDYLPGIDHNRHAFLLHPKNKEPRLGFFPTLNVLYGFTDVYGIHIHDGRGFANKPGEVSGSVLINPAMVQYLGFEQNSDVLNLPLNSYRGSEKVVGVFADLYPRTLRNSPDPFIIDMVSHERGSGLGREYIAIRYHPEYKKRFYRLLKQTMKTILGDKKVVMKPYNSIYRSQYREEQMFNKMAAIMAVLSFIISFIGLWGLISFLILQKGQEISIRKVFGASIFEIMKNVLHEFLNLYILVILIVFPVSWYLSHIWLSSFASYVNYAVYNYLIMIVLVGLLVVLVAAIRIYNAATINPARILKYE